MKKGLQIATNTLIWLAIAIIVLLALMALIAGIIPGSSAALRCQADFRTGCNRFESAGGCNEGSPLLPVTDDYVDGDVADCAIGTDCVSGPCDDDVKVACCGTREEE